MAVAAAVLVFTIGTAMAGFKLRLTEGGGATVTIADSFPLPGGGDINGAPGAITWSGALGAFTVNVTTALSKPVLGSAGAPYIDLNSVNVIANGPGTILIEMTDTDFGLDGYLSSAVGGTITNGTVLFDAWAGGSNVEFAHTGAHTQLGLFGPGAFSGSTTAPGVTGSPYMMTAQAFASFGAGPGLMSWDFENKVLVPEASSLAMLLPGLLPLGLVLRKRMKKA